MTATLFDCHCHLQDPGLAGQVPAVLARARAAGVTRLVCCGTREADWDPVLALARAHPAVLPMLGLHPWFVDAAAPGWLERLRARLAGARAGLGECGLDFSPGRPGRAGQEAAFGAQWRLAAELAVPLAIHCVRAWGRLLALLRSLGPPVAGALVHDFSGSAEVAAELQDLGLHLSFSPAVLRPGARTGPRALAAVAGPRLLLESDAPRGARSEPAQVATLAQAAAGLRAEAPDALAAQLERNALGLFRRLLP